MKHRITKHPQLEGTHSDHQGQLLALHRTTKPKPYVSEWYPNSPAAQGHAHHPLEKNLSLTPTWHNSIPFSAGSDSICCQAEHLDSLMLGCSPASCPPVCTYILSCPIPGANLALALVQLHVAGDCPHLSRSFCKDSTLGETTAHAV